MNKTIRKSTAAMLAVASALTAAPVSASELKVAAPLRQCGMMDNVPSADQLLDKADLGDRAVGQTDVSFFANNTKTVNESEVTVTASFGPAGCLPTNTVVTASVRSRQSEGPGILPTIATGLGIALGGTLQGALTKASTISFTGGNAYASSSADVNNKVNVNTKIDIKNKNVLNNNKKKPMCPSGQHWDAKYGRCCA